MSASASLTIRDATLEDAIVIAQANADMAMETEDKPLDHETLLAGVKALLADPARGRYWIAERDGQFAGQIMVTTEWSDWRNGFFWWVQSVYIAAAHRRQGIYSALYDVVKTAADARGDVCGIRLYVEVENNAAIATYQALGMHDAGYRMFEVVFDNNKD
ncbi:MAG: N-acetyltransferase [Pseudomonadota bacterium]